MDLGEKLREISQRRTCKVENLIHDLYKAAQHIPKQYINERLTVDLNQHTRLFEVCGNGYVLTQAEDSEVAYAICQLLNVVRKELNLPSGREPF